MTQPAQSKEDEILDELLSPKNLGGPIFVEKTMTAIRQDIRRRRTQQIRAWIGSSVAVAASLFLTLALWQTPQSASSKFANASPEDPVLAADAAFYEEMLALESLLQPADALAEEENRQTLNFLIALTQN